MISYYRIITLNNIKLVYHAVYATIKASPIKTSNQFTGNFAKHLLAQTQQRKHPMTKFSQFSN